jgi:hypothetical protein
MQLGIGSHLDDADLEQYSMGKLPEVRLAPFEEHLLACESCQDRLLETEAFVNAVRSVSPKLRAASSSPRSNRFRPRPTWVAAFAMGVVLLGLGRIWLVALVAPSPPMDFAAVVLQSSRGIEGLAVAKAPAGKPLALTIDLTELPPLPSYRLEIVNSGGKPVWQAPASARDGRVTQRLPHGLNTGQYYVRLYTAGGQLLREFGLRID